MSARTSTVIALLTAASPAAAQVQVDLSRSGPAESWTLQESDRLFLISRQAATMAPMTFRVGTVDSLQAVQALGSGFDAEVFGDLALLSWLQLGVSVDYGDVGDPSVQGLVAPAVYAQAQILRQATAGLDLAGAVNFKKYGFSSPTADRPNDGEVEGQVLLDRRWRRISLTANGVFGKSISVPDSDAEVKLGTGYYLLQNLLVGLDGIGRYDTSFDGGPQDGTRYWEVTGGPMLTWKISNVTVSGLAGVSAPMHAPAVGATVGPIGMVQLGYSP